MNPDKTGKDGKDEVKRLRITTTTLSTPAYPRNLEIAPVTSSTLSRAQFPLPTTVSCAKFGVAQGLRVTDVPYMPDPTNPRNITDNPYMLMYTMEHDNTELVQLRTKSTILFGASACGKTLLLQSILSTQVGSLLVLLPENTKNFGTGALTEVVSLLETRFASEACFMDRYSATDTMHAIRRDEAEHAIRCVLVAHLLVKQEWERIHGHVTPKQWLLLQLHPEIFFPNNSDWIAKLAMELYKNAKPESIEKVQMPDGWIVTLDSAQLLQDKLKGMFQSSKDNSLCALLSPTLAAIHSVGSSALLAGSGYRMIKAFESGVNIFTDFPRVNKEHIKQQLTYLFNEQASDPALAETAEWLFGRARLFTRFVEERSWSPELSLKTAIDEYVQGMTTLTFDMSSIAFHVRDLFVAGSKKKVFFNCLTKESVEVDHVCTEFENAAWIAFNGAVNVKLSKDIGLALVEYELVHVLSLVGDWDVVFEPLVLQAMFDQVFSTVDFMERRLNTGFEFEKLIPSLLLPALFASDNVQDMFALSTPPAPPYCGRVVASGSSGPPQPLQEYWRGVWRWSPRFGAVASVSYPFNVWLTAFMENNPVAAAGCYPDDLAGPDYVTSLVRWEKNEQTGTWSSTMDRALVLVQIKHTATLGVEDAKLTVDPQFVYCKNRKSRIPNPYKNHAQSRSLLLDIVKTVPVLRIVVSGITDGVSTMDIVKTNREDGTYPHDVVVVLQGAEMMNRLLGVHVAQALREYKCVGPDE